MAKQHGLGAGLFVAGYDVSGDTQSLGRIAGPFSPIEVTDITQSAVERRKGQISGEIAADIYFDDAAGAAHAIFSTLPRTDVAVTYVHKTATVGTPAVSILAKQVNYDPNRSQDGDLLFSVQALSNGYGLEWGKLLTAGKRTDSSATSPANGTDMIGGAGSHGLQAYCHIFSLGSGTPTIKLQESSDDGAGDAYADITGGGFTINSANTAERIQTARGLAVEQYVRVITTGTFTDLVFAVHVKVNQRETLFS